MESSLFLRRRQVRDAPYHSTLMLDSIVSPSETTHVSANFAFRASVKKPFGYLRIFLFTLFSKPGRETSDEAGHKYSGCVDRLPAQEGTRRTQQIMQHFESGRWPF